MDVPYRTLSRKRYTDLIKAVPAGRTDMNRYGLFSRPSGQFLAFREDLPVDVAQGLVYPGW